MLSRFFVMLTSAEKAEVLINKLTAIALTAKKCPDFIVYSPKLICDV